jgi:hypothetical protein
MITILNLLFVLSLALAPAPPLPAPPAPTAPASAAGYVPHCPCDIGHKDW